MQLPSFNGNWIDLVIIVFVLCFIISSLDKGFLINLIDLAGFIVSFITALKFYSFFAHLLVNNFGLTKGIANAISFILLAFVVEAVYFLFVRVLYQLIPAKIINSLPNKIFGPLPAVINSLIIIAFFLSIVIATPVAPSVKKMVLSSKLGNPIISRTQSLEQEMANVFGEAVLDTLTFITIAPSSTEKVDLKFRTSEVTIDEEAEMTMLNLVNRERMKAGLSILSFAEKNQELARSYAKDMLARGYFSHINPEGESPFDRLEKEGINFYAAGENLAFAPTMELAHQGLMQSEGHRANILSEQFNRVGIGVVDAGIYGKMFVQEFTD